MQEQLFWGMEEGCSGKGADFQLGLRLPMPEVILEQIFKQAQINHQ